MFRYLIVLLFVSAVFCISTSSHRPNIDLEKNIVSEEEIFPREQNHPSNHPFNVQTLPPPSLSGLSNKPNENQATMYLGSFQVIAMPMTGGLPPGFPSTFGNYPNMFGNKNE